MGQRIETQEHGSWVSQKANIVNTCITLVYYLYQLLIDSLQIKGSIQKRLLKSIKLKIKKKGKDKEIKPLLSV